MAPRQKTWAKIRAKARDQGRQFLQDIATSMPDSGYLKIARKNQDLDDAAYQIEVEKQEEEKAEQKIVKDQQRKEKAKARYHAKKLEEENDPELAAEAKAKRKAYAAKRKAAKEAAKVAEMAKRKEEDDGKDAEMPDAEVSDADSEPVSKKQKQTLGKRPLQVSAEDEDDESESEKISKKNKRAPVKKNSSAANFDITNPISSKKDAPAAKVDLANPPLSKKNTPATKTDITNPIPSKKTAPAAKLDLTNPLLANCGGEQQWPLYPGRASRKASNTIGIAQIPLSTKGEFFKALTKAMGPFADRGAEILMDGEGGVVIRFPKADTAEMVKDEIDGKDVAGKKVQITYVA